MTIEQSVEPGKVWFKNWFESEHYLTLYRHRDRNDALKLIKLVKQQIPGNYKGRVLDVGCGSGRHSIEFARQGYNVTGYDLSNRLLSVAQTEARGAGVDMNLVRGDIRSIPFKAEFDLVMNIFTSWGYFESDSENRLALKNAFLLKKKSGRFLFDFLNAQFLKDNLVPYSDSVIEGTRYMENRRIENNRVIKDIEIEEGEKSYSFRESVRLFDAEEILSMIKEFGAETISLYGDYDGSGFNINESPRFICIAS